MGVMYESVQEISNRIEELEKGLKANENVSVTEIKELENSLSKVNNIESNMEYLLRHKLLKLRKEVLKNGKGNVTKWDLFVSDINDKEGLEEIKELVNLIDEKKEDIVSQEELSYIEEMYAEILPTIHQKLSMYDRDRAIKEFNKRIRLFNNRLNRVIEDDFGAWIKQLRLSKGYSLKELESVSGVTASYIHRIESGSRKTPSVPIAERLALGLGVSPDEFLKKLNIATTGQSLKEDLPLSQVLALNSFTINDVKVTTSQKNEIINLINLIINAKWDDKTKFGDSMQIVNAIDNLKKIIPYVEKQENQVKEEIATE